MADSLDRINISRLETLGPVECKDVCVCLAHVCVIVTRNVGFGPIWASADLTNEMYDQEALVSTSFMMDY